MSKGESAMNVVRLIVVIVVAYAFIVALTFRITLPLLTVAGLALWAVLATVAAGYLYLTRKESR
jgi:hypothetical protein